MRYLYEKYAFQSHYGAIATWGENLPSLCIASTFNPTMVRLQLFEHIAQQHDAIFFQSHYGAIATQEVEQEVEQEVTIFQSHYGAIATKCREEGKQHPPLFQSHYGAIATRTSVAYLQG